MKLEIPFIGDKVRIRERNVPGEKSHLIIRKDVESERYNFAFLNIDRLFPGDVLRVDLQYGVESLRIRSNQKVAPVLSDGNRHHLHISDPCTLRLAVNGEPRTRIRIVIPEPELPDVAEIDFRIGVLNPQMVIQHAQYPVQRYFKAMDKLVEMGCTMAEFSWIAPWNQLDIGCPFETDAEGNVDITRPTVLFEKQMRTLHWLGARNNILTLGLPFEMITMKAGREEMFRRNPLSRENNNSKDFLDDGWINNVDDQQFGFDGMAVPKNSLHLAFKAGIPGSAKDWMVKYIRSCNRYIPGPCRPFARQAVMLESTGKSFEIEAGEHFNGTLGTNLEHLYADGKRDEVVNITGDKPDWAWRQFFAKRKFVVQHHNDLGRTAQIHWIKPVAEQYDLDVYASIDGAKNGKGPDILRRPAGSRPNAENCAQIARDVVKILGHRAKGLFLKVLNENDLDSFPRKVVELIK